MTEPFMKEERDGLILAVAEKQKQSMALAKELDEMRVELVALRAERDTARKELAELRADCTADYRAQLMAENWPP